MVPPRRAFRNICDRTNCPPWSHVGTLSACLSLLGPGLDSDIASSLFSGKIFTIQIRVYIIFFFETMQAANRLGNALRTERGLSFGAWQMLPGTNHARIMAKAGYDWICVDTEHGNIAGTSFLGEIVSTTTVVLATLVFWSLDGKIRSNK